MMDRVYELNEGFKTIGCLRDIQEKQYTWVEHQRPPGYAAMTRVYFGRLSTATLNDAGATCSCIPEEQLVLIVNHVRKMEREGKMSRDHYNYPLQKLYRYRTTARMQGAGVNGVMDVEFAALLRIEFIPDAVSGHHPQRGPTRDVYFKVLKQGTARMTGCVLGWPTLDHPSQRNGEGLGWRPERHGHTYTVMNVTLPRTDGAKKSRYLQALGTYDASGGSVISMIEEQESMMKMEEAEGIRNLRSAALQQDGFDEAYLEPCTLDEFMLQPGERMVVPVKWERRGSDKAIACSTHPEAPAGLAVLPGICGEEEEMSVVVENESQLAVHVTDRDPIVIGCEETQVPSLDDCRVMREQGKKIGSKWTSKDIATCKMTREWSSRIRKESS